MSREGANNRIDSLKNSLNHDHYQRTALGSAVRFNTMLNVLNEFLDDESRPNVTKDEFARAQASSVNELISEYDNAIKDERDLTGRFDSEQTIQQRLQNRAYKTALGQSVAKVTTQQKGLYQDFNTSYSTGATGAFRSFTNGFVQDDEDFFGSRVLYDNVFGNYEDGTESLSNRKRLSIQDPLNDNRTVSEKVLDDVVSRSIYDQTEIIDRVDIEFGRFHGQSMIDQYSMTGSGLRAARQTIRSVMAEGSAYGRQVAARGESDDHPTTLAQALISRTDNDIDSTRSALNLLNNNLSNRSSVTSNEDGGYVNKAGVAEFIDLINTAGTRNPNGSLTGGRISISSFQFQNETISAALTDKIQRHVLESVLQGGGAPLEIDLTLAYPRQRNINDRKDNDGRYAVGQTNYGILGPNLIEALKLEAVKEDIQNMLRGLGISPDKIDDYVNLNVQFRDKKFHPKVYLTDNRASIGTQNLTAPVGTSINQAGSNFETMRFVNNTFTNDNDLRQARSQFDTLNKTGSLQNNSVTQSLLYRQIVDSVNQERQYNDGLFNRSEGNTSTPIFTNQQGSQVGFAGDIYQHLKSTLDFAYASSFGYQNREAAKSPVHMFMILDQAFMLQLGSTSYAKQLKGEMGNETGIPYSEKDIQAREYNNQQHKLFDLLIANKASVVVDSKNYKEQVLKPLTDKIYSKDKDGNYLNKELISNFERQGKSLSILSGFSVFTSGATSIAEINNATQLMFSELRRLGFNNASGFNDSDLKQIVGLASGNIEMAQAPRQHAKEFGLMQYGNNGPELISYYQGSSNMGLYSLGINSGENGVYQKGDGDLTNTEMGIMLGRRDINSTLSRSSSTVNMSFEFMQSNNILGQNVELQEWILGEKEEEYELALAQRHLSVTWNQLSQGSNILNPNVKTNVGRPSWQDNINTTDLNILKNRLEAMSSDLGLSSDAFSIKERYGNVSGSGVTSIDVTIDLARAMNSGGFMNIGTKLPKLNFELTVLQGPSRGNGMFLDSADDGSTPGFVYFVDKNKIIGNGLFVNESSQNITLLGRHKYEDNFVSDINNGGRVNLRSGQSAHMSSLDIVPQLFATLMGEAVSRFGSPASINKYQSMDPSVKQNLLLNYVSTILTGHTSQIDESIKSGPNVISAMSQIKNNLDLVSLQHLNETINRHTRALENKADTMSSRYKNPMEAKADENEVKQLLKEFNNNWFYRLKEGNFLSDKDVFNYISDLNTIAEKSPQLTNMIMKTSYRSDNSNEVHAFKEFQTLLFGSFLQSKDDKTYAGQQGFYKTLLMGVGSNEVDKNTAVLMFDLDTKSSLNNLGAYARFKPLEYNPLTNIHANLYRSIASKSTSLTKNNADLDSILLESEARDLGDAANLRLMSSIGIGNIMHRDDFIIRNSNGDLEVGRDQKEIFEAMEKALILSGGDISSLEIARQSYLKNMSEEFGSLDSEDTKDTIRLNFYTGSSKKLSQLPQRIKNAMGARPMYQYSIDAQMALERGNSLNDLSNEYLQRYRDPLLSASKNQIAKLLTERELLIKTNSSDSDLIKNIDSRIDDLKVVGAKGFTSKTDALGAIFSGRIKSVLNNEQVSFILKTRERLEKSIGEAVKAGELSEDVLEELIRVEVLKAGLTNKGLGRMVAGSDHMKYGISLVQLSGTYIDTFSANPLYGTVYKSENAYSNIRNKNIDIYDRNLSVSDRDELGVYTLGMKEGQYETRRHSVKGSKMGAGGMEILTQQDDIVVQDKQTGRFVHKRKINGEWVVIGEADNKRNLPTIRNVIDNNGFSPVGSPSLSSKTTTIYGREGQNSTNYIYSVDSREGNFANNEYVFDIGTLTSQDPSSGQRVEGTDTAALVKGVAMFVGRIKYNSAINGELVEREMNLFENIEDQILKSYEQGNLGGSLKSYLDNTDSTQRITLQDGREGYAPLSSSIQGLFNANNFKSFFWSHGATIIRAQDEQGNKFMLNNLFDDSSDLSSQMNAKKLAASLLLNFGTSYIQETKDSSLVDLKRSLVSEIVKGEFGSHYQQLALTHSLNLGDKVTNIFNDDAQRKGRDKGQIAQDLLFDKIGGESNFSKTQLPALAILNSSQLQKVLQGDTEASKQLLTVVRKGIIDPVSERASRVGGINFTNSADRQAALVTTAVDFMHQLYSSGSKMNIASDIDFDNIKMREVLLNIIGLGNNTNEVLTQDIMDFLSGVNSNVTALSVFTDITYAYGKDPVSTSTIAKHEAQHLIEPFLGDIKKYQEGGKLSDLQHTVAELAALVSNTKSGLVFYDQMAKAGFNDRVAINLASEDSDYLFSSFNKQKFLGFYQSGMSKVTTIDYVSEYENINKGLVNGAYDWNPIQTVRDAADRTKLHSSDPSLQEDSKVSYSYKQVERFVNKFHSSASEIEKARLTDKYLSMGGDRFAMYQLDELTNMMIVENNKYQSDPSKKMGMDSTGQFLDNMRNDQMFISIPDVDFEMQNGEIVAKPSSKLLSTVLPSAADMRILGGEYSGFVDPVIKHYKTLSSIFVPGTITNSVFEKIRLSSRDNRAIILSTEEYKAIQSVMEAASAMPIELKKATSGARTQEAFGGKNKYEGFTATGIGSFLMPFGAVVASQSKLDNLGLQDNSSRYEAIQQSNEKIKQLEDRFRTSDKYINTNISEEFNTEEIQSKTINEFSSNNINEIREGSNLELNIYNFYKRQRAAEVYGISKALEEEFDNIKLEAIQTKNRIIEELGESSPLNSDGKKAAFNDIRQVIKQKRDVAYQMASLNPETGKVLNVNDSYDQRVLSEQDRYIYHAQALNYDALLAEVMIIGNAAKLEPLSVEIVSHLDRTRKEISQVEFLLNSFEDKEGLSTFVGLGHKQANVTQDALFSGKVIDPEGGMVGKHVKAIKEIGKSFKGLGDGASAEAKQAKIQYAVQQIESSIQMYKKRSEDMNAFNVERETYNVQKTVSGDPSIDPAVSRKIDSTMENYNKSTREVISFLEDQKSKLLTGEVTDNEIRNIFENIDLKIVENDKANIIMGEVFRSPTAGGTDPRLHTYVIMQGIQSLNVMSQMLSDTKQTGNQPKMMYSTERGQTATVMAALGVTTYGGGDWDGDPYTTIFTQMAPVQKAIQDHQSNVDRLTVTIENLNRRKLDVQSKIAANPRQSAEDLERIEVLESKVAEIEESIASSKLRLQNDTEGLKEAKTTLESQIKSGHNNFSVRARKQVANYMGIDEAFFVKQGEVMFDAYGSPMLNEDGQVRTGINIEKTFDADAMFVFLEKGYSLVDGIQSSGKDVISIMNNVDIMLGHRQTPEAFKNGEFLDNLVKGIVTVEGKISNESPAIGMLKDRVTQLQNRSEPLTGEEKMFVNSLKDAPDEQYKAYLQQFKTLSQEMEADMALHNLTNNQLAEEARKDYNKRAFINQWIGGNLYSAITSDTTLGKFMAQGNGMTLTEGTFDMTLKTLGKAGGEVLGKTYNTIIGATFQDAPVISYGRQMLQDSDLAEATKSEFTRQLEGDSEYLSRVREEVKQEGLNPNSAEFSKRVKDKIQAQSLSKFEEYQELTRQAVLKSEGTQGFMKNIHQLLRDSIKLKDGDGSLITSLKQASETYDDLSKQITANDEGEQDKTKRLELIEARDQIISGMASKLGPGPGLKSLINLDYLTNESDKTGLSKNEFEQRFLADGTGGIENNRKMLESYSYSMTNLTDAERDQLRSPDSIQDDSTALMKVARNMTASSIANMVASFRMDATAVEGRSAQLKNFANSHKAQLATKLGIHSATSTQTLESKTRDGEIDISDEAGKYIQSKYGLIEVEKEAGIFDANRQHKNALGIHLGIEEAHMYNDDGSVSDAYRKKLDKASKKLGISNEEYTLMFDIHNEQSREQINGVFGEDGNKMEQFTVMNMMRKDIARSMLDGRTPSARNSNTINENIGSEVLTTMAQLAAQGKLDSQGMDIFSGMYRGVMGHLLEATDSVVEYRVKGDESGEIKTMQFSQMTPQQKSAYMTKLVYQNMIGTQNDSSSGFNRSTSQESKDWKTFNNSLIANSVLELDENGRLSNDFIDALDKAGANTSTGQQVEMYEAMGEEYFRNSMDNEAQRDAILQQYLPSKGPKGSKEDKFYREQINKKIEAQIKYRQEADSKKYETSRSRHSAGKGVLQRSSFMNKISGDALSQLSTNSGANALDLFVPLALTMIGGAISSGSVDSDQVMQLGGATFTAFQYARTGLIDSTDGDQTSYKRKLAGAQAMGGVFKFKNALAQHGDENVGMAVAQMAVQETTSIAFNAIATPWLSKQIAEKGLGIKHAPALNSLEMTKYAASQQLAGNLGASVISAVSSTIISGLFMKGVESMSESVGNIIESFIPAANAVNAVNESISKRRQQEAAYAEFEAETDDSEGSVKDYMVMTSSSYDTNNYAHLASLEEVQDIEPSTDGNLSVDLLY